MRVATLLMAMALACIHGFVPATAILQIEDHELQGTQSQELRDKLEYNLNAVPVETYKQTNLNLQLMFNVKSTKTEKKKYQVKKFVANLHKATNLSKKCFCMANHNKHSKKLPGCGHEFHDNCLFSWLAANLDNPDFDCPTCTQDFRDAIDKCKAGFGELGQAKKASKMKPSGVSELVKKEKKFAFNEDDLFQ